MKRIAIVEITGSGKTTLSRQIAAHLDIPHVELDSLYWLSCWQGSPVDEFRQKVERALQVDCWIVDGNYRKVHDIVWRQADTLVWMDYPLYLVLWRLFWRTIYRIRSKQNLWDSGNVENWRTQFFSRDSLFFWALKTYKQHRRAYPNWVTQPQYAHLHFVHLRSPRETDMWLKSIFDND